MGGGQRRGEGGEEMGRGWGGDNKRAGRRRGGEKEREEYERRGAE